MLATMAAPRTATKTTARTPRGGSKATPTPKPTRADGRPKSLLTLAAEAAATEAKRALLLKTLNELGWNLSRAAEALEMPGASQVIRAIRDTGLDAEYEAARAAGKVRPGGRAE